jgi:hypothetical protein
MGCDHVLIPNALSAFANGKELFLQFEIAMSETPRRLNLVPRVPLRSDGPELTRRCGPGSRTLPASRASEYNGAGAMGETRDGSICVSLWMDGIPRALFGLSFGVSRCRTT